MGLSEEYKKRIQESLDAETGGRLHAIAAKATAVNAPVLIIGLGGTGMDALRITKKLIYDTIQSEKKDGEYTDKPKNIEYLGIDTDEGEEKKSYQGMYLNKTAGEIQIYTMPHVQPVLAHPELLPPYINSWLNTNIDTQTVISGAGAVRQLGRLLLMQNISKVQTILESKIKKATSGFDTNVPMYVFILAGISGGTGSGKTTMLNALSHFIPPDERIVTIEDSAELRLNHISNLVQLEARNKNLEGRNEITIRDLIREALRMRPDRIIVGEVRSVETLDMLQAMNTGHDGSLSTGHGNNPADMLKRLETMVLMAADIPLAAVRGQIASAIDVMVHLARFRDGSRKVVKIVEVTGIQDGEIMLESLYDFQEEESKEGTVGGKLLPTGKFLRNREKLENAGTGYIPGISDEG